MINETMGNSTENYKNVTKIEGTYYYTDTSEETDKLINISNLLAFFYPLIAGLYSKALYETKCMTKARSSDARISPNLEERNGVQLGENGLPLPPADLN
jgi:hypothetical protein